MRKLFQNVNRLENSFLQYKIQRKREEALLVLMSEYEDSSFAYKLNVCSKNILEKNI